MKFQWDENKNKSNLRKHGVSFETAKLVFDDPNCLFVQDRIEAGEERWRAIGMVGMTAVALTVVHTYRGSEGHEIIRIVSARRSTKQEERQYGESL